MLETPKNKMWNRLVFSVILITIGMLVPLILGLSRTGFDTNAVLTQFFLYTSIGTGFLIGIWLLEVAENQYSTHNDVYGSSLSFFEPGDFPALKSKLFDTNTKVFLFFGIVFSLLGIFAVYTGTAFSGIGAIGQQFKAFDNILFNITLVVVSENLGAAFIIALSVFTIRAIARKVKMGRGLYVSLIYIFVPLATATYGLLIHILRYGSSDIAQLNVFGFWLFGGVITLLIGSFIPFAIGHATNNLVLGLKGIFSNTIIYGYVLLLLTFFIVLYSYLFKKKKGV
jgi:hypothetical protein